MKNKMIMKPIEEIQMRWPGGWYHSYELSHYIGTTASVRILKLSFGVHANKFRGLFYFRFRRQGSSWQYFTVDM